MADMKRLPGAYSVSAAKEARACKTKFAHTTAGHDIIHDIIGRRLVMAKRAGAYKSEKRKKELMRQKKQEEKRKRRLFKADGTPQEVEGVEQTEGSEQAEGPEQAATDQAAAETGTKE